MGASLQEPPRSVDRAAAVGAPGDRRGVPGLLPDGLARRALARPARARLGPAVPAPGPRAPRVAAGREPRAATGEPGADGVEGRVVVDREASEVEAVVAGARQGLAHAARGVEASLLDEEAHGAIGVAVRVRERPHAMPERVLDELLREGDLRGRPSAGDGIELRVGVRVGADLDAEALEP